MKSRQQSIIYHLAVSDVPLTAEEIAKRLAVSPRTIKSEMKSLHESMEPIGAILIAKRNKGYSLQINDAVVFKAFTEELGLKQNLVNSFAMDDVARFLYIARKLVSSSKYVKIDNIADELYISRSTLRESIKDAMDFLKSYRMVAESKPGLGIRTYGMEYNVRVAMTELFAIHFHKTQLNDVGMEYAKWLNCDKKERQDIRHNFLRTLVKSGISILDLYTQRLAIYLIIVRNRIEAGYQLRLPKNWVEEMKPYREYQAAQDIYANLSKDFTGYEMSEEETTFLAILLLCNRDMGHVKSTIEQFPSLYDIVKFHTHGIIEKIRDVHNFDLQQFDWAEEELTSILIPMVAKEHFCLSGARVLNEHFDSQVSESPLVLDIARTITEYLQVNVGEKLSETPIIHKLSCFIYKILFLVSYEVKKRKLLFINYDGIGFTAYAKNKLLTIFEPLIESCTCVELYEIRAMNQEDYDAVLMDTPEFAYNYELPKASIRTITREGEMNMIYNNILIHAYQYKHLLPKEEDIHLISDYVYTSEPEFFQYISAKHCKTKETQEKFEKLLMKKERMVTYRNNKQSVIVFGSTRLTEGDTVELYSLKKPGTWSGEEIHYILYICVDWRNNPQKIKALENSLCQLAIHIEYYRKFQEDKSTAFEQLICQSLKL